MDFENEMIVQVKDDSDSFEIQENSFSSFLEGNLDSEQSIQYPLEHYENGDTQFEPNLKHSVPIKKISREKLLNRRGIKDRSGVKVIRRKGKAGRPPGRPPKKIEGNQKEPELVVKTVPSETDPPRKKRGRPKKNPDAISTVSTVNTAPPTATKFTCKSCPKAFKTRKDLKLHGMVHKNIKSFSCKICQKQFKFKQQMRGHYRLHENMLAFECDVCNKKFKLKQQLDNHMKSHNEAPFNCIFCDKAFKFKEQLLIHSSAHEDERPYKCETCDKAFKLKQQLDFHERIHSDLKPYICEVCDKSFKFKQHLEYHSKSHSTIPESYKIINTCNENSEEIVLMDISSIKSNSITEGISS
ncbi:zinc finger protein 27-like [Diabrotica virgifera virgifera]|uniref:Zinc finger protein 27-like n=1 Tax=Diabrotica virgifera virgifera TaxID=50390 RepID=A0A6P7G773_DIAVI|nr:zinc finger protein 27-like [Diabrotica virgifera virgifera]